MKNKLLVVIVSLLVLAAVVLPGPVLQASPGLFQSPPPGEPVADFWWSPWSPSTFDNVYFDNDSYDPAGQGFASIAWDFGDGATSTEWSLYHRFAEAGEYEVSLTVTTYDGRSASTTRTVTVYTPPPVADFWWSPWSPSRFDIVYFYNGSYDPVGQGFASIAWDFGDGATSTESSLYHWFAEDGEYEVSLMVTTNDGRSASTTRTVTVYTPPPVAEFGWDPWDPSVFDTVLFYNGSWDPANNGIASVEWDLGDGTASTDWDLSHTYAAEGDYTVHLGVTTWDGRTASVTKIVPVRTHDVAITKFTVPTAASSGQTRSIVVGLNSKRYLERVEVTLWKSVPGGEQSFGSLIQSVPVRPANRTTDFKFSYTFTAEDAAIGKVTFKARANILDYRDALPADNEAIAMPTKVSR